MNQHEPPAKSPVDPEDLANDLVDRLIASGAIRSAPVESAFRSVPRHQFIPDVPLELAYSDRAVTTKRSPEGRPISSSTQPAVMGGMLEQLELGPGQRVLEIGAGTGFNAALMAHIVGPSGTIITMDVDDDIVSAARERLERAGYGWAQTVKGDGVEGFPEAMPYDRIILTVGAHDVAPAWIAQLAPGGRLVMPLVLRTRQKSIAFEHRDGAFESVSVRGGIVFMPLRETALTSRNLVHLNPDGSIGLEVDDAERVNALAMREAIDHSGGDRESGLWLTSPEAAAGLATWLELRDPDFCQIFATRPASDDGPIPDLIGGGEFRSTFGIRSEASLALLMRVPGQPSSPSSFQLAIRTLGMDHTLAGRLLAQIHAWDEAGRPTDDALRVRVFPVDALRVDEADGPTIALRKRWSTLVCDWPRIESRP